MTKILSSSGRSLSDVYDVKGSIIGIEELDSREVTLVHEMGSTIFSERFSTFIRRVVSAATIQNTNIDVVITDLPAGAQRILGLVVFPDVTSRIDFCSVAVRDPLVGRELPIWVWDSGVDIEVTARLEENGGGVATRQILRPVQLLGALPHLSAGAGQPQRVPDIALRGLTSGFGAGNVTLTALIHIGFSQVGGLSSRGLPIPSW